MQPASWQTSRFCASCGLYWPYHPDFANCKKCTLVTVMKSVPGEDIMTMEEAKRFVAHLEFDRWVRNESDEDRAKREAEADRDFEQEWQQRDSAAEKLKAQFDQVIEGAGFTKAEQEMLQAIERALPPISQPRLS